MSITVTISSARQLAGVAAAAASASTPDNPISASDYLQSVVEKACESYREQFAVDRVTSSAFVARFTTDEYGAIRASADPIMQAFVARVAAEPYVWLGSDEVQQGMAYCVGAGLLTSQRAGEIAAY